MKAFVALRLLNKNAKFPESIWQIGYVPAPNGYAFKPLVGSFDVIALAAFAQKNGFEADICDLKTARAMHGLPV